MKRKRLICQTLVCLALALTSCEQREEELSAPVGDTGQLGLVFSIGQPVAVSRMSSSVVQADASLASFRGIDSLTLIPFIVHHGNADSPVIGGEDDGNLSRIGLFGYRRMTNFMFTESQSVLRDFFGSGLLGTRSFLGYGKANTDADEAGATKCFTYGILHTTGLDDQQEDAGKPSAITFRLVPVYDGKSVANTWGPAICEMYNQLVKVDGWADVADERPVKMLFNRLTAQKSGASGAAQRLLADIYRLLSDEANKETYRIHPTETDNLRDNILAAFRKLEDDGYLTLSGNTLALTSKTSGYPANLNMPDGSAYLGYNSVSREFKSGLSAHAGSEMIDGDEDLLNFVYPPSLYYRLNSPIQIADDTLSWAAYKSGDWSSVLRKLPEPGPNVEVRHSTHAVAIVKPFQYAVGRLDMTLLLDMSKMENCLGDSNEEWINVGSGLPVTALFIGGQQTANWAFRPSGRGGSDAQTIYSRLADNNGNALYGNPVFRVSGTRMTVPIRTLVLETYPDDPILIVVEFLNTTGRDFHGLDGQLIPAGSPFYLVGDLDPSSASTQQDGDTQQAGSLKVFEQNKITTVSFKVTDLKSAYLNIPDLRNAGLHIGLRVNPDWQSGISKDYIIGQ